MQDNEETLFLEETELELVAVHLEKMSERKTEGYRQTGGEADKQTWESCAERR